MDDLTIVTCSHNTPEFIHNLVKSIRNVCDRVPHIFVVETGNHMPYSGNMVPNTHTSKVSYHWICNESHGNGVNRAMEMVKTKYMLLVDSDVLFLKDIKTPYEKFKNSDFTLMGEVVGDRGGKSLHPRVNPWFCFMNLKNLKEHNILFYDHYRTKEMKSEKIYDIGSSMFEDVVGKGLWVGNVYMEGKYFKHYEGMSWRVQKYDPTKPDTDIDVGGTHNNRALYEYGLKVQEQYEKDVANL